MIITFIRCLFNIYVICKYFCYDLFLYCNGIRLTLLYEVVATLSPVESNDTFNILPGPSWDRISWPELIFQKCTTPSFPAVVKMFSFLGETAILFTRSRWSSSLKTHSPFKVFQIRIVPSNEEDIRRSPIWEMSCYDKNRICILYLKNIFGIISINCVFFSINFT